MLKPTIVLELLRWAETAPAVVGTRSGKRLGEGIEFEAFREMGAGEDIREVDWIRSLTLEHPVIRTTRQERGPGLLYWHLGVVGTKGTGLESKGLLSWHILEELVTSLAALPQPSWMAALFPQDRLWQFYPPAHPRALQVRLRQTHNLRLGNPFDRPHVSTVFSRITPYLRGLSLVLVLADWSKWSKVWEEVIVLWGFLSRHNLPVAWLWVADRWEMELPSVHATFRVEASHAFPWLPLGNKVFRAHLAQTLRKEWDATRAAMASLGLQQGRDWAIVTTACTAKENLEKWVKARSISVN